MKLSKEQIAKVCHDVNKAYCESLGDDSQPEWKDAPQWQKDSAMLGVTLHTDNPNAGPDDSHNSWLKQKEQEGWKYGPIKNPELKEHPCCVPYNELPKEQQAKDYIFRSIIHSLNNIENQEIDEKITKEYLDNIINNSISINYTLFPGTFHTVCCVKLQNGSTVIGESVCVSSSIFNEELGRKYALENVKEKLEVLEGYSLCEKRFKLGLQK